MSVEVTARTGLLAVAGASPLAKAPARQHLRQKIIQHREAQLAPGCLVERARELICQAIEVAVASVG